MSLPTTDPGRHPDRGGAPLLQIQDATVVKNRNRVLDRINLTIREGEHTAILGPNGAGKSSLIRLIAHQDYPLAHEDGTPPLLILGEELWNVFELRSLLGIVSGGPAAFHPGRDAAPADPGPGRGALGLFRLLRPLPAPPPHPGHARPGAPGPGPDGGLPPGGRLSSRPCPRGRCGGS